MEILSIVLGMFFTGSLLINLILYLALKESGTILNKQLDYFKILESDLFNLKSNKKEKDIEINKLKEALKEYEGLNALIDEIEKDGALLCETNDKLEKELECLKELNGRLISDNQSFKNGLILKDINIYNLEIDLEIEKNKIKFLNKKEHINQFNKTAKELNELLSKCKS